MIDKDFYKELEKFIEEMKDKKDDTKILNFVVDRLDTIPREVIKYIAEKTGMLEVSIENTINFYPKFRSKVRELKEVMICTGMNCGPNGGKAMYDEIRKILDVDRDGYTKDKKILITQKRCFGRCAKGPNISIDGEIFSFMSMSDLKRKLGIV